MSKEIDEIKAQLKALIGDFEEMKTALSTATENNTKAIEELFKQTEAEIAKAVADAMTKAEVSMPAGEVDLKDVLKRLDKVERQFPKEIPTGLENKPHQHREYPKVLYGKGGKTLTVNSAEEDEKAQAEGFSESPK